MQGIGKVNRRDTGSGLCLACRQGVTEMPAPLQTPYKKTLPGIPESLPRAPQQHDSWFISGKRKQKLEGPANSDGRYCVNVFVGKLRQARLSWAEISLNSLLFSLLSQWSTRKGPLPDPQSLQRAPFSPEKDSFWLSLTFFPSTRTFLQPLSPQKQAHSVAFWCYQ